jgi:hypothetical protein
MGEPHFLLRLVEASGNHSTTAHISKAYPRGVRNRVADPLRLLEG